jgi:Lrp/AsnC family transcriptional regulator, leucine-responsive regulatory protein
MDAEAETASGHLDKMTRSKPLLLDDFDLKILAEMQRSNLQPIRAVADAVALSTPAVARRLQRLREHGVISRDVSIIDPNAVGQPISLIVEVCIESEFVDHIDSIETRFLACPQIQQCYYVTGEVDFILIMLVRDMQEYEALTRTLFFADANVRHFRTFVAMKRVKVSQSVVL